LLTAHVHVKSRAQLLAVEIYVNEFVGKKSRYFAGISVLKSD